MYHDRQSNVLLSPIKICFISVDQYNDYYLQVWKNSLSSSKTWQHSALVRVSYDSVRIYPGSAIFMEADLKTWIPKKTFGFSYIYLIVAVLNPILRTIIITVYV